MASPKGVKHFGKPKDGNTRLMVRRTVAAAVVGGTVAEIGGGKFANGAAAAAMVHLFNAEGSFKNKNRDLREAIVYDPNDKQSGHDFKLVAEATANSNSVTIAVSDYETAIELIEFHALEENGGKFDRVIFLDHGNASLGPVFSGNLPSLVDNHDLMNRLGASLQPRGTCWLWGCNAGKIDIGGPMATAIGRPVIAPVKNVSYMIFSRRDYSRDGADLFHPLNFNAEDWKRFE